MSFKCDKCNFSFIRVIDLERHKNRKIPCDRVLKCNKCNKVFSQKSNLEKHMQRKKSCINKEEVSNLPVLKLQEQVLRLQIKLEKERNKGKLLKQNLLQIKQKQKKCK